MIVATAGHIDHGKSSLIRAITGVNTDTLPEEVARGISIDLGFAYWNPGPGVTVGFIDVPGHERFLRNMLAGVCSIDLALIVVAADDGVMPQTTEHVQILDLLGVGRCVVVVTKTDRVDADRVRQVTLKCRHLLANTKIEVASAFSVSSLTGSGTEELKTALALEASAHSPRHRGDRNFRLAIDRVFTVVGRGTVVTGTALDGSIALGDRVVLSPGGVEVRVRGLQCAGVAVKEATAGQRCAINILGAGPISVSRGDLIVAPAAHLPTMRLEARLLMLPGDCKPLRHLTRVHLHIGTADVIAKLLLRGLREIIPGQTADVMLVMDRPVCASNGDRFIVRDQSASYTIGGGYVLNSLAGVVRFGTIAGTIVAQALSRQTPTEAIGELLEASEGELDADGLAQVFNMNPEALSRQLELLQARVIPGDPKLVLLERKFVIVENDLVKGVAEFNRTHPEQRGMSARSLRSQVAPQLSAATFVHLLRKLTHEKRVAWDGTSVWLPEHRVIFRAADTPLWQRARTALAKDPTMVPTTQDLAKALAVNELLLEDMLRRKRCEGEIYMVTPKRFFLRASVARLAEAAADVATTEPKAGFSAAQYRDAIQTGRTLAIQILEFFDRMGLTRRIGDRRKMVADYALLFGPPSLHGDGNSSLSPPLPEFADAGIRTGK